jgi:DNA-binding GntR family transcriptional regulator
MEIALAERLGVSRTPIREAMRKLEMERLVVMIPRRGAQVANITEKDLNDVLDVRIALENMVIEKACQYMTEEEMDLLMQAAEQFRDMIEQGNLIELAEYKGEIMKPTEIDVREIVYRK